MMDSICEVQVVPVLLPRILINILHFFLDAGLLEILLLCDVQINQLPSNNKITIFIHVDHVLPLHEAKGNDKGLNTNRTVGGFHIPMIPITQSNKRIDVCNLGASLPRRNHQEGSNDISIDEKVDVVVGGFDWGLENYFCSPQVIPKILSGFSIYQDNGLGDCQLLLIFSYICLAFLAKTFCRNCSADQSQQ